MRNMLAFSAVAIFTTASIISSQPLVSPSVQASDCTNAMAPVNPPPDVKVVFQGHLIVWIMKNSTTGPCEVGVPVGTNNGADTDHFLTVVVKTVVGGSSDPAVIVQGPLTDDLIIGATNQTNRGILNHGSNSFDRSRDVNDDNDSAWAVDLNVLHPSIITQWNRDLRRVPYLIKLRYGTFYSSDRTLKTKVEVHKIKPPSATPSEDVLYYSVSKEISANICLNPGGKVTIEYPRGRTQEFPQAANTRYEIYINNEPIPGHHSGNVSDFTDYYDALLDSHSQSVPRSYQYDFTYTKLGKKLLNLEIPCMPVVLGGGH